MNHSLQTERIRRKPLRPMAYRGAEISVEKLKSLIAERDTTVAAVSRKLGISPGAIFAWYQRGEKRGGVCGIDSDVFEGIQKLFGVSAADLKPDPGDEVTFKIPSALADRIQRCAKTSGKTPAELIDLMLDSTRFGKRLVAERQRRNQRKKPPHVAK